VVDVDDALERLGHGVLLGMVLVVLVVLVVVTRWG